MPESHGTPESEARALLPLLQIPNETIESVCALIRVTPKNEEDLRATERHAEQLIRFRARVLDYFQVYAGLKPAPELPPEPSVPKVSYYVKKPRPVPKFDRAAMLKAVQCGELIKDVARRMGCSRETVSRVVRANGIKSRGKRKLSSEQTASMLHALESGGTWRTVARQFGISTHALANYVRAHRKGRPEYGTPGTQEATA
jgi:transposase-like protein